jgi:hypothetical protein
LVSQIGQKQKQTDQTIGMTKPAGSNHSLLRKELPSNFNPINGAGTFIKSKIPRNKETLKKISLNIFCQL